METAADPLIEKGSLCYNFDAGQPHGRAAVPNRVQSEQAPVPLPPCTCCCASLWHIESGMSGANPGQPVKVLQLSVKSQLLATPNCQERVEFEAHPLHVDFE
jgi:hypothetical protein